ncbi:MAG: LamG-like jellyroll fold domain-containing protein [Candidatus Jorgensenbacteria bacterium]
MDKLPTTNYQLPTKNRSGFTLTELLVVVAITAVISAVGFVGLGNYKGRQVVQSAVDEMSSVIRATRQRSMAQEGGGRWGVHFANATTGISSYTAFRGYAFATGTVDRQYSLPSNISFSNPFASSTYDMVFAPLTGAVAAKKVFSVVSGRGSAPVGDLVVKLNGSTVSRLESGLVGYWHLDENTSSTAYDASGLGNNGTLYNTSSNICSNPPTAGCPTWWGGTGCKGGGCLGFDGANEYVLMPTAAGNVLKQQFSQISISAWVYPTSYIAGSYGPTIISNTDSDGWAMRLNNGYLFVDFRLSGGNVSQVLGSSQVPLSTWTYLAITYDGTNITGYINGQAVALVGGSGTMRNGNTGSCTVIGNEAATCSVPQGSEFPFLGRIDEVRVYNRALSAAEILSQYNDLK